jgi:hypothetical protein
VIQSISIQPSLTGYISKGIALYGKGHVREVRVAFDVASIFTNQVSRTNHFLLLIKVGQICPAYPLLHSVFQAIVLFNAAQHEEAMLLVNELAAACPNANALGCHVVEVSVMRLRSVINADLCNSYIRHICAFSSESMSLMARVMMKPLTISLPLSIPLLSHRKSFI